MNYNQAFSHLTGSHLQKTTIFFYWFWPKFTLETVLASVLTILTILNYIENRYAHYSVAIFANVLYMCAYVCIYAHVWVRDSAYCGDFSISHIKINDDDSTTIVRHQFELSNL